MDHGNRTIVGKVGVRISVARFTMRSPARVADTDVRERLLFADQSFQGCNLTFFFKHLKIVIHKEGDTSTVVPSIFQTLQAGYEYRVSGFATYVAYDSTHKFYCCLFR